MTPWNKTDFDAAYAFNAEPDGHPNTRPAVELHYHEHTVEPILRERWRRLSEDLNLGLQATDIVVIVGAGFGWGVRALKDLVDCEAIGTDVSDYIHAAGGDEDRADIEAEIIAVGLDPTTGRGLEVLNACATPGNRMKELVLNEDLATGASRGLVHGALSKAPTWIFVEDIVDDSWSDADITTLAGFIDNYLIAKKRWIYSETSERSGQDLATLTGQSVITTNFDEFAP